MRPRTNAATALSSISSPVCEDTSPDGEIGLAEEGTQLATAGDDLVPVVRKPRVHPLGPLEERERRAARLGGSRPGGPDRWR